MDRRNLNWITWSFVVLTVLVVVMMFSGTLQRTTRIPQEDSQPRQSPSGSQRSSGESQRPPRPESYGPSGGERAAPKSEPHGTFGGGQPFTASSSSASSGHRPFGASSPASAGSAGRIADSLTGFLRHTLDQLHLNQVDTGDLLILILLFFLFREDADEELLVSLGLLLIL